MAFCSACGTKLPDDARFCPGCGVAAGAGGEAAAHTRASEPPPASFAQPPVARGGIGVGMILPILVLIAIVTIGWLLWTRGSDDRAAEPSQAVAGGTVAGGSGGMMGGGTTAVSASTLDADFFANPATAAARYPGPVRVSGIIATMVTPGPTPALSLEGRSRFNYMIVNFPVGYRERLAPLSKGQAITVDCRIARALGGTTILDGCALV